MLNRRNFLKTSIGSAAAATLAACNVNGSSSVDNKTSNTSSNNTKLNISFQEGTLGGDLSLKEKLDLMEENGIVGLEVSGKGLSGRVDEFKQALEGRNIKFSAICAGFDGFMLSEDENIRNTCRDTMREIITAAGKLGSTGVIIVPAFNSQQPCKPHTQDTRDFLCEWFNELGTFAHENGTTVILEPLNRREAFYMRLVADAASICRDINNPGVTCLGDFWHMTWEETSDMGAFLSAGKYLQHVHIASRKNRSMPGEDGDADNYIEGFRALKMLNYDKYVSFECGCQGENRVEAALNAVKLMREQWEKA